MSPLPRLLGLRTKLTLAALAPLFIVLVLVALCAFWLINEWILGETQKRVRQDLATAHEVLSGESDRLLDRVRLLARSLEGAGREPEALLNRLDRLRAAEKLDFLCLIAPDGPGDPHGAALPLLSEAAAGPVSATVLLHPAQLETLAPGLALRARVPLRGPDGEPTGATEERGMALLAASPLPSPHGAAPALLLGGILLNNNLALADRIRSMIYGGAADEARPPGSATLFLDEVRIATTIRLRDGRRALGTRISAEVAEAVLGRGQIWLDRARVVDRWYLTGYEPVLGEGGRPIGALYVGLLEAPFTHLKAQAVNTLLSLLLLGVGLGYFIARILSLRISRPLLELGEAARRIGTGARQVRLPVPAGDELGRLSRSFNQMAEELDRQQQELKSLNRHLEEKVEERTALLEHKSLELLQAQRELVRSERLAALGELAAGVAHEINNPAAIIRGNAEILEAGLAIDAPEREETREILKQTERISRITTNLLRFSREQALQPEAVDLSRLIRDILAQITHQSPAPGLETRIDFPEGMLPVQGDREGLRQLFTNILLNALQAMEGSGKLRVRGSFDEQAVEISISDSGPGMPPEVQEKIFNPFFTTKSGGTGLGLSLSYGIVRAHQGRIGVDTAPGQGTTFRIWLPRVGG